MLSHHPEVPDHERLAKYKRSTLLSAAHAKERKFDYRRARKCIEEDFLGDDPKFNSKQFKREFGISPERYRKIKSDLQSKMKRNPAWVAGTDNELIPEFINKYPEFLWRSDGSGKSQIHPDQKLLSALNQLCLGIAPEHMCKYFQVGTSTARQSKISLCQAICELYGEQWLCPPRTVKEIQDLMKLHQAAHGIRGMRSIDWVHWYWEASPLHNKASIIEDPLISHMFIHMVYI